MASTKRSRTSAPQKHPMLLILDMNGVLMKRNEADRTQAIFRPHTETFIERMWKLYPRVNVGVWSSMAAKNLNPWVDHAFGEKTKELAFIWDQTWCTKKEVAGMRKPLLRKDLVWLAGTEWAAYQPDHVLLIDDDPIKCTKNPKHTAVHPSSFDGVDDKDEELLWLAEYIEALVRSDCPTVPQFVSSNPYHLFDMNAAKKERTYLEAVGDEDVNMIEVFMKDLGQWVSHSAKDIQELPSGKVRIELRDGKELVVAAKYVRDVEEAEEPEAKKRKNDLALNKSSSLKVVSLGGNAEGDGAKAGDTGPSRLPAGWKLMRSRSDPGQTYYYNTETGESSFEAPLVRL